MLYFIFLLQIHAHRDGGESIKMNVNNELFPFLLADCCMFLFLCSSSSFLCNGGGVVGQGIHRWRLVEVSPSHHEVEAFFPWWIVVLLLCLLWVQESIGGSSRRIALLCCCGVCCGFRNCLGIVKEDFISYIVPLHFFDIGNKVVVVGLGRWQQRQRRMGL